jgi:hypothetical protein
VKPTPVDLDTSTRRWAKAVDWLNRLKEQRRLRDRFLVVYALTDLLMGLAVLFGPAVWHGSTSYGLIREVAPIRLWGLLFACSGLLGLVGSYNRKLRPAAYLTSLALTTIWALGFLIVAIPAVPGELRNIGAPLVWGNRAVVLWMLAGRRVGQRGSLAAIRAAKDEENHA